MCTFVVSIKYCMTFYTSNKSILKKLSVFPVEWWKQILQSVPMYEENSPPFYVCLLETFPQRMLITYKVEIPS